LCVHKSFIHDNVRYLEFVIVFSYHFDTGKEVLALSWRKSQNQWQIVSGGVDGKVFVWSTLGIKIEQLTGIYFLLLSTLYLYKNLA
jgi:hypothetical protein